MTEQPLDDESAVSSTPHQILVETSTNQIMGSGDDLTPPDVEPDYYLVKCTNEQYQHMLDIWGNAPVSWCDGNISLDACPPE